MKRLVMTLAVLTTVLGASPAWAHEEINPKSFPTGTPTFFTLSAANEEKADYPSIRVRPEYVKQQDGSTQDVEEVQAGVS